MKFGLIVLFFSCFIFPLLAQTPGPFVPDSNTVALWHFDESSGTTLRDASSMHNDGIAVGTSIVSGKFVNARYFNGFGDYAYIPDPPNGSLDFDVNQSFTLEAWFKTTSFSNQRTLRKGLAPAPGYELLMNDGYVGGIIGNRQDGSPPDTLLVLKSSIRYNDNVWHLVNFVRDREARKLFLYVDGFPAATPITDFPPMPFPIVSR